MRVGIAEPPLNDLALVATSVADDVGFVALRDLSEVMGGDSYRLIGGHMVTALVARWNLGRELYRETQDADLGVPPVAVRDAALVDRLLGIGYQRRAGNRFGRIMTDIPVRVLGVDAPRPEAVIDILIPTYNSRVRDHREFGDHLVTTEVPGLATALRRPAADMSLTLQRLNGEVLKVALAVSDEVSAIVLKALATSVRSKATDVVDLWRCLEIGYAARLDPTQFDDDESTRAAVVVRKLFAERGGFGMSSVTVELGLTSRAADERFTRISALVDRVLGAS